MTLTTKGLSEERSPGSRKQRIRHQVNYRLSLSGSDRRAEATSSEKEAKHQTSTESHRNQKGARETLRGKVWTDSWR